MNKDSLKAKVKMAFKVILVLCLLVFFNTSDLLAENIIEGSDWATEAMLRWQDYGILNGTSYGVLAPEEELTKVEAITILNRINNVEIDAQEDESKFKDVESFRWYYREIEKAVATGLITGDANGNLNPKELLTREIGFSMIAKLFSITYQGSDSSEYLKEYFPSDCEEIGNWSRDSIAGLVELGYIDGYEDGTLRPDDIITRGEFITLLDKIVDVLINVKGEYDLYGVDGTIVINVPNIILDNVSDDAVIYMMAGSNNEYIMDKKENPTMIVTGTVESNTDYSAFRATRSDNTRKKLTELKIFCNMPTADDLSDAMSATYYGRVKGTDIWNGLIYQVSKEEEIDPVFVKCIMALESGGTPGVVSKMNTNGTYDYGLMQVNSSWASSFDLQRILDDDEYAIRCGIKVIKRKIAAAESAGMIPSVHEVAWRYNGKSEQGRRYADKFSNLYEDLSGVSRDTSIRVIYE